MLWLEFLLCAGLLVYASYNLCKEGIIISQKTHIEEGVIGMFFLAIATSFPEIVTSSFAVFPLNKVGLGYGDIVGSVMFNFMLLVFVDYMFGKGRLFLRLSSANKITARYVFLACSVVFIAAMLRKIDPAFLSIGKIGVESVVVVCVYVVYLRAINRAHPETVKSGELTEEPILSVWTKFGLLLLAVMVLGSWMAKIGNKMVVSTGLSESFTGALFLGIVTSLPEAIVSLSAVRVASYDMAVGNILGSNMFDVCIIPLLDGLYNTPILGALSPGQVMVTGIMFVLSGIVLLALAIKKDIIRRIPWDTALIFVVGFTGFMLLYYIK